LLKNRVRLGEHLKQMLSLFLERRIKMDNNNINYNNNVRINPMMSGYIGGVIAVVEAVVILSLIRFAKRKIKEKR